MVPDAVDTPHVVRLLGVPAALFLESQNHQHDLVRELTLIELGNTYGATDLALPRRLANLIGDILHHYADVRSTTRDQALAALDAGAGTVDLDVPVVPDLVAGLRRWLALVEEADEFCSSGDLLTVAASPEIRALRRWYVEAITTCLEDDGAGAAVRFGDRDGAPRP